MISKFKPQKALFNAFVQNPVSNPQKIIWAWAEVSTFYYFMTFVGYGLVNDFQL